MTVKYLLADTNLKGDMTILSGMALYFVRLLMSSKANLWELRARPHFSLPCEYVVQHWLQKSVMYEFSDSETLTVNIILFCKG